MAAEIPKRLTPTSNTVRELFLKSGNLCAFPNCPHLLMNADGVFISQICHIEAAEPGGPRFNEDMTNEERRDFSNLMLMCHQHHKVTDDVTKYSSVSLKQMKESHESRFASPERVILDSIKDWTKSYQSTMPKNLGKLLKALGATFEDDEREEFLSNVRKYIAKYQLIPLELRVFFSEAIARTHRMSDTPVVISHGWSGSAIYASDLESAFRISTQQLTSKAKQLEQYGIASIDEVEDHDYRIDYVFAVYPIEDWPFWSDLALYCAKENIELTKFTVDMQFDKLDLVESDT